MHTIYNAPLLLMHQIFPQLNKDRYSARKKGHGEHINIVFCFKVLRKSIMFLQGIYIVHPQGLITEAAFIHQVKCIKELALSLRHRTKIGSFLAIAGSL